ncbi:hypothetical protein CC1G_08621 [Coprinopsis cinerea okayama7|uniref:Uncharacterized protein n=1 Tax=Coprinopsis cinerea (strain Okayama-7 / 130 / ATCC MYA-4618 / FGSC 9003) TaxID=240176 RepID=A8N0S4_COPC7|nr:hypothetical protein CC1G_08621 [Coprinopsis cinerea okayama7\|eukprot:XP_001828475.1 hypothetical protein CC1G_08621 [Coprinopsis cinerea okayama7\
MLKRQRQPSPVPSSSSSIPLVTDCGPDDISMRNLKRRRTQPPPLDGASRGWNNHRNPQSFSMGRNDGDEEDYYESDEDDDDSNQTNETERNAEGEVVMEEYKSTNNLLRELHILQQHRLLFSGDSTTIAKMGPPQGLAPVPAVSKQAPSSVHSFAEKQLPGPCPEKTQRHWGYPGDHHPSPQHPQNGDETLNVHQNYGDTNRLLRELFLSRRRGMEPEARHSERS